MGQVVSPTSHKSKDTIAMHFTPAIFQKESTSESRSQFPAPLLGL